MTDTWRVGRIAPALLGAALAAGCGDEPSAPAPNQLPITEITGGPTEGARVASRITFFFRGSDYDGTVREFDWLLDTYAPEIVTRDQITLDVPAIGDPRWARVSSSQVTMTAPADVLRGDPQAPTGNLQFDRWSTFYVRAIDNEGGIDGTPEAVTFQAFTEAPLLRTLFPARVGETVTLPRTFAMNWDGSDAIGTGEPFQEPLQVRWAFLPATLDGAGAPIGFPQALYDLPESEWTDWKNWVEPDSSGRRHNFIDAVPDGPNVAASVFALQGLDDAGAITPRFERDTQGQNNYVSFRVDGSLPVGPRVTVHAFQDSLSAWAFDGTRAPQIDVPTALDTVQLYWDVPAAAHYGGRARESRYGWNITNLGDDNQWTAWSTARVAGPRALGTTPQTFYIQCRDDIGTTQFPGGQVTTGKLVFQPVGHR